LLLRLQPEDLSSNLILQLGSATEELNRSWCKPTPAAVDRRPASIIPSMAANLDDVVEDVNANPRPRPKLKPSH
jgi:hypothetical protein